MKKNVILPKKLKFILTVFFFVVLVFAGAFFCRKESYAKAGLDAVELFVFAPCESCNEEEKFSEEVRLKLDEAGIDEYDCNVYNAYKESGAARLEKIAKEYGLNISISDLPVAIAGEEAFEGTYAQIGEKLGNYLSNGETGDVTKRISGAGTVSDAGKSKTITYSDVYRDICNIAKDDMTIILFVTGSCESCNRAEEYLESTLKAGQCNLLIYNIMEDDNAMALKKLMKIYEVPDSLQLVPLLFTKSDYLSGADAILKNVTDCVESPEAAGSWDKVAEKLLKEKEDVGISKIKLALAGFINGLNPCGISMLLMVLSVLLMSGRNFFRGSFTYLAGKLLTYLFLGFTIGSLLNVIEGRVFKTVYGTINIVFAILSLCFGLFYLMDFIHVLRKDYGKERLRLPERFRRWNHNMIKKFSGVKGNLWYPLLFLLGIVISAGEFLCTGQVYLATLLYMAGENGGYNARIVGNLMIYLTAMCVPMILLTIIVAKGKNVMSASRISLKLLPVAKLACSIFFFVLFVSLLF